MSSSREKFLEFHRRNPDVLNKLIYLAREAQVRGHKRISMTLLFNVLRWEHTLTKDPNEAFKLNNNYAPYYSRSIEKLVPGLRGFFTKRRSVADANA